MSWEFDIETECPHCDEETYVCAMFNDMEFGPDGGETEDLYICNACGEEFWFHASLRFEVDIDHVEKKKPKPRK